MTITRRPSCLAAAFLCAVSAATSAQSPSPAERSIAAAERAVSVQPQSHEPYNALALALARRARETSDPAFYERAAEAVARSLELAPDNFEARKMRVWVLLGQHEFARALALASALNDAVPDDLLVYGFLADAHAELGNYDRAEEACQWMLDLRPGNIPALTRAAYLRELFGDIEGAIELMRSAYQRAAPGDLEDRAWMLTQLAHLELVAGRTTGAEALLAEALTLFPEYHYALSQLARVRTEQGRHVEAVDLLKRHYQIAPHAENLHALAEALSRAGLGAEAERAYQQFEIEARQESDGWDNANRELIFYYAGRGNRPAEAFRIAQLEMGRRRDVYTLDAYAWALHVNGRSDEARAHMDRALAVGVRDPEMLARARAMAGLPE